MLDFKNSNTFVEDWLLAWLNNLSSLEKFAGWILAYNSLVFKSARVRLPTFVLVRLAIGDGPRPAGDKLFGAVIVDNAVLKLDCDWNAWVLILVIAVPCDFFK